MQKEKRLIDAGAFCKSSVFVCGGFAEDQYWNGYTDALDRVEEALEYFPEVDAVMLSDLEAWLYEIAMNNVGEKFDGDFSDAVEEIISRLDGLRVFAEERRTDG